MPGDEGCWGESDRIVGVIAAVWSYPILVWADIGGRRLG